MGRQSKLIRHFWQHDSDDAACTPLVTSGMIDMVLRGHQTFWVCLKAFSASSKSVRRALVRLQSPSFRKGKTCLKAAWKLSSGVHAAASSRGW